MIVILLVNKTNLKTCVKEKGRLHNLDFSRNRKFLELAVLLGVDSTEGYKMVLKGNYEQSLNKYVYISIKNKQ